MGMVPEQTSVAFRKLMSKDYYGTYAEGIKNLDREVADMAKTDLREYSFADMKVVFPSADIAVITFKTTIQPDFRRQGHVWYI